MKTKIIVMALLLISSNTFSQTTWQTVSKEEMTKVMEKVEKIYRGETGYSVQISHASFKDYTTKVAHDKASGYFIKDSKNNYHSFLLGIHSIQNEKYRVVVDSSQKTMMISGRDGSIDKTITPVDYTKSLEKSTSIKNYKTGTSTVYRVEFSKEYPYSAYEMETDADAQVKKLTLFFNKELPSNPNDKNSKKTKPRVEITFNNYKKNISPAYAEHFDHSKYMVQKEKTWVAAAKYKGFKVMDLIVKQ